MNRFATYEEENIHYWTHPFCIGKIRQTIKRTVQDAVTIDQ